MPARDVPPPSGKPGSQPAKADWRGKPQAGRPGGLPRDKRRGGWWIRPDQRYELARRWHRIKLAVWSLVALGLIGMFVWIVLRSPQRTPFLAVAVTDYASSADCPAAHPIPPNAWVEEDFDRFRRLGDEEKILRYSSVSYAYWESELAGLGELRQQIISSKAGGPDKNLVIVYLSMHGVVDGDGRPCLLPPGASPHQSDQWLPLVELLGYLFPKDSQDSLPAKKLLILDANRMDANWRLGLLYNSFADRLEEVHREANIPGLVILNSTGPDQIGWTSPEQLGGSVFGYFLWQGLKGAADNVNEGGDADNEVSLWELRRYLETNVRQWVQANRADVQKPMLVPDDAEDVGLVYAKSSEPTSIPAADPQIDPRWEYVEALWEAHHTLSKAGPQRFDPLGWEQFQQDLLRLEQLLLAGSAYRDAFDGTRKQLQELAQTLAGDRLPANLAAYSLPLARLVRRSTAGGPLPKDLPTPWKKAAAKADSDKPRPYPYLAASAGAFDWLAANPTADNLTEVLRFVDQAQRRLKTDVVEVHFLRMLASHLDLQLWQSAPDNIKRAIAARGLAERAAAAVDERVHYWIQQPVEEADADRRSAEDKLFVGEVGELAKAAALWTAAAGSDGKGGKYGQALATAARLAAAFQLRDRAWAQAPYLAQWLTARLHQAGTAEVEQLDRLIEGIGDLAAELDGALAEGRWSDRLGQAELSVRKNLDALNRAFQDECSLLWESRGADSETLRRITTVLALPLVSGQQRNLLRKKYLRIAAEVDRAAAPVAPAEQEDAVSRYLERLARTEHPALAILAREKLEPREAAARRPAPRAPPPADDLAERLERRKIIAQAGEQVRLLLAEIPSKAEQWAAETSERLKREAASTPAATRTGRSKADRLVRAAAVLMDSQQRARFEPGEDPPAQLRRLDMHHLLLWHAHRALEDFWGPSSQPYFQIAAGEYLNSARALANDASSLRYAKHSLPALCQSRTKAAAEGIRPKPKDLSVDEDETSTRLQFASISEADNLPKGEAALYLRVPKGRTPGGQLIPVSIAQEQPGEDRRRLAIPVQPGKEFRPEYWIRADHLSAGVKRLEAVALYRGHVYAQDFTVEWSAAGLNIVHLRPAYPHPTITVKGEATQGSSIVFILDYSGSMYQRMLVEKEKKKVETRRFHEAREALNQILRRLADSDQPYQVGLRVYGHRYGWAENDTDIVVWDPKNPGRQTLMPGDVQRRPDKNVDHPSDDVELILPLGSFTRFTQRKVSQRLGSLKPLGETPLYLAITQAVNDLRKAPKQHRRHVVVITDGVNFQSSGGKQLTNRLDVENLLKRSGNNDIRLDVVGFQMSDEDLRAQAAGDEDLRQKRQSLEHLKALAQQTADPGQSAGAFHHAKDPVSLLRALEKSLKLSKYVIRRASDGAEVTAGPVELNRPTEIDQSADVKVPYVVQLAGARPPVEAGVELEGGEALELYLGKDRRRLEHRRYEDGLRASFEDISDPAGSRRSFYIAAHLPEWESKAVRFFVSVQNAEAAAFSPRPAEAWVEVRPLSAGSAIDPLYIFYDLEFVADRPVPVISCRAPDWPLKATDAEIRLWCKLQKTRLDPRNVRSVDDLGRRGRFPVEGVANVTFELDRKRGKSGSRYRVILIERHPPGGNLDAVKVQMKPAALEVVHRFNRETATVRHTFFYNDSEAAKIGTYSVLFTPRESLFEKAVTLPKPLKVGIPRQRGRLGR